jgi:hypothetical protein
MRRTHFGQRRKCFRFISHILSAVVVFVVVVVEVATVVGFWFHHG